MFTEVKNSTKKGLSIIHSCLRFEGITLDEVYGRYSRAKDIAYHYCMNLCKQVDGYNIHICSHNSNVFTVGFEDNEYYYYITPSYNYRVAKTC